MQVEELSEEKKAEVREEWRNRGADRSDLSMLDSEFSCSAKWFAVVDNEKNDAIFDVREAPNYQKNMKVIFAPDVNVDVENGDYAKAKPMIVRMVSIVAKIIEYHLKDLFNKNNSYFKIYSDHEQTYLIFYEICRYLEQNDPDKFELKLYGKWLEIHAK